VTLFAGVFVKTTIVAALALAVMPLLQRRSAALRHWVLAMALACAAAMPLLTLVAPAWHVPFAASPAPSRPARTPSFDVILHPPAAAAAGASAPAAAPTAPGRDVRPDVDMSTLIVLAWACGVAVSAAILAAGFVRLRQIAGRAERVRDGRWIELTAQCARVHGVRQPVTLLRSDHPTLLVTWGVRRPTIILPVTAREWSDDRARIVLHHELAHVSRADWLIQMIGEIARGLNWFNPVMWAACRRLRRESERACDDALLNDGVAAAEYASHLVALARASSAHRRPYVPAPAMARPSGLQRRIAAMLNARVNRTPLTRRAQTVAALVVLGLALSIAGVRAQRFSTFSGTVTDQTNLVLPGVAVTLANPAAQTRYEVRSDRTGHFELPGLSDGEYQLAVDTPGFAPIHDTVVIVGHDITRALQMQVGDLHETISVTAGRIATPTDPSVRQAALVYAAERSRKVAERCAGGTEPVGGNIGGNILAPTKVADFKPHYPENMQAAKIGGVVTLEALIGIDGSIRDVRLLTGDPDLGSAAADAIRQWQFSPTYLNCTPVEVRMGVTANFLAK
jgi:TonB family protein